MRQMSGLALILNIQESWFDHNVGCIDDDRWAIVIMTMIGIAFTLTLFLVFAITFPFSFDLATTVAINGFMTVTMVIIPASIA